MPSIISVFCINYYYNAREREKKSLEVLNYSLNWNVNDIRSSANRTGLLNGIAKAINDDYCNECNNNKKATNKTKRMNKRAYERNHRQKQTDKTKLTIVAGANLERIQCE